MLSTIRKFIGCALLVFSFNQISIAQRPSLDLTSASLEELLNLKITSAAKREQTVADTAAAVYVITQEDIRRSGALTVADVLRLAPGVQVAQIDGSTWAISIRGFNYRYANKLLVLIDGRAVYTPSFSGVYWELQDMPLQDIERIEVIRGPGASLWGANAVNGVINIITRGAQVSQGGLVSTTAGSRGDVTGDVRYGGQWKDRQVFYTFFGRGTNWGQNPGLSPIAVEAYDGWHSLQSGGRADWAAGPSDSITLSSRIYRTTQEQTWTVPLLEPPFSEKIYADVQSTGGHILGNWKHRYSGGSETTVQSYYSRLDHFFPVFGFRQHTADVELEHRPQVSQRHNFVLGGGFRTTRQTSWGSFAASEIPDREDFNVFSGFIQDEVTVVTNQLWLTVGSKFESNNYTGFNLQPTIRLRWRVRDHHTFWVAVSRALRTPSNYEEFGRVALAAFPTQNTVALFALTGQPGLEAEQLLAYELGYRAQLSHSVSLDWASFYNQYRNLIYCHPGEPYFATEPPPPHLVSPFIFQSNVNADSYGMELSGSYAPVRAWKLSGGYSWLRLTLNYPRYMGPLAEGDDPEHQFNLRSYWSLRGRFEVDTFLYYVSRLRAQPVPSYLRLDTRLGWHPTERLELSLSFQNLLAPRHPEFVQSFDPQGIAQAERSAYGRVSWTF